MFKTINFFLILIVIFLAIACFFYWHGINKPASENSQDQVFVVSSGESVNQISENLYNSGLIGSKFYFELYVWRKDKQTKFQAGEYLLNPSISIREIVEILTVGRSLSKEMNIKIIEGWNIRDINEYLKENNIIIDDSFMDMAKAEIGNWKLEIRELGELSFLDDAPPHASLEGYLFPDTYRIYQDATLDDIVVKMLDNFDKKLTGKMRSDIAEQGKTIYEIITMASVVEKEVRTEKDMKIVSGVFWDRIKYGQPLQSCATLAYVLGVNKKQYTTEDTKIDSPYNTYQNKGLPPGPICNPGLSAIQAAIYPEFTDYNYFLSRPDTGETVFSKTFKEHNMNKDKYLR